MVGMLAGQRHAMAAIGPRWLLPWLLTNHHAAPADGAVAIHPFDIFLQHTGYSKVTALQPAKPAKTSSNRNG
jgi:hypothetical protein